MGEATIFINLGLGGLFLFILFLGLSRGQIYTRPSVEKLMEEQEKRHADKDRYIAKLEEINERVDQRNDLLASKIDHLLEISRAQGMIEALPPTIGERVVK